MSNSDKSVASSTYIDPGFIHAATPNKSGHFQTQVARSKLLRFHHGRVRTFMRNGKAGTPSQANISPGGFEVKARIRDHSANAVLRQAWDEPAMNDQIPRAQNTRQLAKSENPWAAVTSSLRYIESSGRNVVDECRHSHSFC